MSAASLIMASSLQTRIQALADRLDANRRVLILCRGHADFEQVCNRQKLLFHHAFSAMPRIPQARAASLAEAVRAVGWSEDDEIISFVLSHAIEEPTKLSQGRTALQDFTSGEHYLPTTVWPSGSDVFVDNMCDFLGGQLGLQHASEHTIRKLASIAMLAMTNGREAAMQISFQSKRGMVDAVKASLKRHRGAVPVEWVSFLPASPDTFRTLHPRQWQQAYGEGRPAICPFGSLDVSIVTGATPCRNPLRRTCIFSQQPALGNHMGLQTMHRQQQQLQYGGAMASPTMPLDLGSPMDLQMIQQPGMLANPMQMSNPMQMLMSCFEAFAGRQQQQPQQQQQQPHVGAAKAALQCRAPFEPRVAEVTAGVESEGAGQEVVETELPPHVPTAASAVFQKGGSKKTVEDASVELAKLIEEKASGTKEKEMKAKAYDKKKVGKTATPVAMKKKRQL